MAIRRSLLRIDKASLLETFGSLKIRNFGYTSICLQLLRKSMSNFSLFFLHSSFSYFRKSLTVTFPYLPAISLQIFIISLDSTKLKIVPHDLKSFLLYKFTCASCCSSYIGETCRHFKTRIEEHVKKESNYHIFKHLYSLGTCFDSYNSLCFKIIDKANSNSI